MKYKLVVFDLDGTLVKSDENIYWAMIKAFEELEINYNVSLEQFRQYIGWNFIDIFPEINVEVNDVKIFIEVYKKYYYELLHYSVLYPGVEETLAGLKNNGIKISLLTTKAQDQADVIIDHFNLRKYFDYVMGRRPDVAHKPDPEPLQIICRDLYTEVTSTVMVGDSEMDIRCGKNAGSLSVAVDFGYRTLEQIKIEEPDHIISSLTHLLNLPGIK